ncbi:MAG: ABC transporter ATP-binding protein [Chloroflexi bacterium]|nr:ABC transporter ATP-binding protein [Chloroflexota bacterium]
MSVTLPDEQTRQAAPPRAETLLSVENVDMVFGGLKALNEVTTQILHGQIKGIIGPNGAGKSTLFNVVTGIYTPTNGDVCLNAESLVGLKPNEIAERGIARTFQTIRLFGDMSVLENVMVGQHVRTRTTFLAAALRLPAARREERAMRERAHELLALCGIPDKADTLAGNLPFGQQRIVEIARALATDPKLLVLDEPASGLTGVERDELVALIRRLRDDGMTIVLVEHDMQLVMNLVDEVLVLDYGRAIAEGPPDQIKTDPAVIAAYLGEDAGSLV